MSKTKKLLDFQANISDVKQVNPLFSTCRVRVLYTGKNRNMSTISRSAVEKALPTLKNIPIVGEFENDDYKGHGGAISMDDYKFKHTTKPYGVVPESATYEWEEVKGSDGSIREYLTIDGCYLWTGRYEEAFSVIEKGKGQSMEIEVTDGEWNEKEESYEIHNFTFSALCILGDNVEPAFEDASITAYSLNKDSFKSEFSSLLNALETSLNEDKEVNTLLKDLLEKYSTTVEDLTAKGLNFSEISEDELEAKIKEVLEVQEETKEEFEVEEEPKEEVEVEDETEITVEEEAEVLADVEPEVEEIEVVETKPEEEIQTEVTDAGDDIVQDVAVEYTKLQERIVELESQLAELDSLREFKLNIEKANHEAKAQKLFNDFQLNAEDVEGLDVHKFSVEEIEEKCYAILGRKMASQKNFSKQTKDKEVIHLPLGTDDNQEQTKPLYGGLFDKYNK